MKTKCSKCGQLKKVNSNAYKARIKKYGTLEEVEKNWVCLDCRKEKKTEKTEKTEVVEEKSFIDENEIY